MNRFCVALWATVAALLLASNAQAGPPKWTYDWSPSAPEIVSPDSLPAGTSKIKLKNESPVTVTTFGTDVTATTITVESDAPPGSPDEFYGTGTVTFSMKIQDGGIGGPSRVFTFTGTFDTQDPMNPSTVAEGEANVKFKYNGEAYTDELVGSNYYTITYNGYTPPPSKGASLNGSLSFNVKVRPVDIQKAPEPSTMLLASMGASFLGFGAWRKRRQAAQAEQA